MNDRDKISIMDRVIEMIGQQSQGQDMPTMIGTMNKKFGLNGFHPAEIGHPVFEFKDRYIIYLESKTPDKVSGHGIETTYKDFKVAVPYYKESLLPFITFK